MSPHREMTGLEVMQDIHYRNPDIEIWGHHVDALDAISANEEAGYPASLVVMAPGLGKTTVMAAHARRKLIADPSARVMFLNDSNDILVQAHERFIQVVGDEFSYGFFSGDGRVYDEISVLFGSFQVMRAWHPVFLRNEFQQGIVDESHHSFAPTYKPVLDYFNFDHLLGATATPDRMDIFDIRDIYGDEVYSLPLEEAIARRLLASVDYHVITDEIVETGIVTDRAGDTYGFHALDRQIFAPRRDEEIAAIIARYSEDIKKAVKRIVFCNSIEQTERYAELFENSAAFTSVLTRPAQREILERFKRGEIDTLLTVDMFNEGIDVPDANQVVLLRQTGSKRIFQQQLGRGLRITPTKKRVQVLDFVNSCEHLLLVDRVWRDIATRSGEENEPLDTFEIDVNELHFNEEAVRILPLLRKIAERVYNPEQYVPLGSVRLSTLAGNCNITPAALRTVISNLKIEPEIFPTKRGKDIYYVSSEDADRIKRAVTFLFD